ncbi:MAG: hypothetical protein OHK0052_23080 [Anaerolineales bacterium]
MQSRSILAITRKELEGYFGSPLALIFLGAFLTVELFVFFTIETFFARGLANVRALFAWMPLLLIFLTAALTMRQWSEEQRSGTLEVLLTLPVSLWQLVIGKFLAVLALVGLALALTLPLPITVSLLGPLDFGPVLGGYLAALLMAAAYTAIGLFVSSRTDNQIVALLITVLFGGVFYLLGTQQLTAFFGEQVGSILRALGSGSRFESIERGVIDLRDLTYYLSIAGIFFTLNVLSLDSTRWSIQQTNYRRQRILTTVLICLNLLLLNVWMYPLQTLRFDLTARKEYTLSPVSKDLLQNLSEPLLIRAYISERTHPLLQPLIPQIRDTLREYEITSGGHVTAEVIDPQQFPELEAEAAQTYGIRPTPFQVAGRYEASVINAYFDILIRYGDQSEVISFQDLIEVTPTANGIDVRLRNLEYDLTSAIKKVVYGFQSIDSVLAALDQPVTLTLYQSANLPNWATPIAEVMQATAAQIAAQSADKLKFEVTDPGNGQQLIQTYGIQPLPADLFASNVFFLHFVLQNGDQYQVIYPQENITEADVRTAIESALKRTASGFLKVAGIWSPPETPTQDMFGQMQQPISTYRLIRQQLGQEYTLEEVNLSSGRVPENIDVLFIIAPQAFGDTERFAIDQYLMRGGSVIVATSNYKVTPDPFSGMLALQPIETGINDLLASYGVQISSTLVLDDQNAPFPIVVNRQVGGFQVQEIQALNYPFFVEILPSGMESGNPIVSNLNSLTLNWASPVTLKNLPQGVNGAVLLRSSTRSWQTNNLNIQPDQQRYGERGFPIENNVSPQPLAVYLQGSFHSYFSGKPAPIQNQNPIPVLETAQSNARLIVLGSAAFLDDFVLELSSRISQDRYRNNLLFAQNSVDWAVEDLDLLSIRARGSYTRLLRPLETREQTFWEALNYTLALAALLGLYAFWQAHRRREQPIPLD